VENEIKIKGSSVPKVKALNSFHADKDGYIIRNCETALLNSECYYLLKGCTGCLIAYERVDIEGVLKSIKTLSRGGVNLTQDQINKLRGKRK
jgi:hypothetical protein